MAKRGRKTSYDSYVEQYNKRVEYIKKTTGRIVDPSSKLSKIEFETAHAELVADREEDIKLGKRKTIGNITRTLVDENTRVYTSKQAKALQKAVKLKFGKEVSLRNIKYGDSQVVQDLGVVYDEISERRKELVEFTKEQLTELSNKKGPKEYMINHIISQEYFGS